MPVLAWLVPHPSIKGTPKTEGILSMPESSGRQDGEAHGQLPMFFLQKNSVFILRTAWEDQVSLLPAL